MPTARWRARPRPPLAGDTVHLRAGTYSEQLVPGRSGTAAQPITFAAYPGESPDALQRLRAPPCGSSSAPTSSSTASPSATSAAGGASRTPPTTPSGTAPSPTPPSRARPAASSSCAPPTTGSSTTPSTTETTTSSSRSPTATSSRATPSPTGRHSLLSLRCGNQNVIRGNTFSNPDQKDLEIYDCEGTSDAPVKLDATKRNLVEGNVIADTLPPRPTTATTASSSGASRASCDATSSATPGRRHQLPVLLRRVALQQPEPRLPQHLLRQPLLRHRRPDGDSSQFFDNRARNNVLYKNTNCSGGGGQTSIANASRR